MIKMGKWRRRESVVKINTGNSLIEFPTLLEVFPGRILINQARVKQRDIVLLDDETLDYIIKLRKEIQQN